MIERLFNLDDHFLHLEDVFIVIIAIVIEGLLNLCDPFSNLEDLLKN